MSLGEEIKTLHLYSDPAGASFSRSRGSDGVTWSECLDGCYSRHHWPTQEGLQVSKEIWLYPSHNEVVGGILVSLRPSVRLFRIPCPLCNVYSSGWIHFIFLHLIKQLQKVCVACKVPCKNLKFWQIFKICNFDLVPFWLGIWCESLVWVIMGRRGVS